MHALAGFLSHAPRHIFVNQARPGSDGVTRMGFRRVVFRHRGGDAALGPGSGGAFADRCGGQHGHRPRRQLQRAEQAGEPTADDEDIGLLQHTALSPVPARRTGRAQLFRFTMRSTARRALAAMAGSTQTSSCI